jgi:hypothetical protein
MKLLKRIIIIAAIALVPTAGAQGFSVWGAAQGGYGGTSNDFHGRISIGGGLSLPIGLGAVGLEITPLGFGANGLHIYDIAAVLRDVPVPFTPIALRGEIGLEKATVGGPFDGVGWALFAGGGVRYEVFGPLGIVGNLRVYLTNPTGTGGVFAFTVGADVKL